MNTRFKFRAWYKRGNGALEMMHDVQATYDFGCNSEGSEYHCHFQDVLDDPDCIVEQCTGLRDKNGNLIYEGDVLRFASRIDVCVTFRNGGFVYSLTEHEKLAYQLTGVIAKETQIIGNIHKMESQVEE